MTHGLANVFVNNQRVEDLDNPDLKIRDIIAAYGRDPERCIVYRLETEEEGQGEPVNIDESVDLAELRGTLYLRCETKRTEAMAPSPQGTGSEGERPSEPGTENPGLSEADRVPAHEGVLGDLETEETFNAEEKEQQELWSPGTGEHAVGDPSGHQFYEREPEAKWQRDEDESNPASEAPDVGNEEPRSLGSELSLPRSARQRAAPRRNAPRTRRTKRATKSSPAQSRRSAAGSRSKQRRSTTRNPQRR